MKKGQHKHGSWSNRKRVEQTQKLIADKTNIEFGLKKPEIGYNKYRN